MVYLDLLNQVPPTDDDKRLQTYYPYIDDENKSIHVRLNGANRPGAANKIFDKVACGQSCYRIRSIFPCSDYKMNDAIVKGAAVTGNALAEFFDSIFGDRYRNPNALSDDYRVICNIEGVANNIKTVDGEIISLPLNARCYFESRGMGYEIKNEIQNDEGDVIKTEIFYLHLKYSKTGTVFSSGNGEVQSTYLGYYIDDKIDDKYQPEDYTWIENNFKTYLPPFQLSDGRYIHIIFSSEFNTTDKTKYTPYPNKYYCAYVTDTTEVPTPVEGDWLYSNYLNKAVGSIVDGCDVDETALGQLTDKEMEEMKHVMNQIENDIYGDRYDTSGQEILSRYGNISKHLTNTISAKNSIATDVCFITHFHRFQAHSTNYLTYVMMDSETVLHPKGYECSIIHDISASDKSTNEQGEIVDDKLNGKITIAGYEDLVTVYNYDRRTGKPTIAPVVIVAVRDDFKYDTDFLRIQAIDHDLDSEEGDVIEGKLKVRFIDSPDAEYFVKVIH